MVYIFIIVKYRVIINDKGEIVGNTVKLILGFILIVIGALIAYETTVYNLLDILIIVGLVIAIAGVILIVSYFVDSNATRTSNLIKDFLDSKDNGNSPYRGPNGKSSGPLKVRKQYNDYSDGEYKELTLDDISDSLASGDYVSSFEDNPKAVLNIPEEKDDVDFERQLDFTPYYGKPLKVTRTPKKREGEYLTDEVPNFVVEPNNNSAEIQSALSQEAPIQAETLTAPRHVSQDVGGARDIKIDINDPDRLPVPKSLQSYIVSDNGLITSQEAFENLAVNVNKEIMLEIPSLKNLSDRFLSHVPTIYSRVIIDEFDVSDMSYMFLISSLLKQGVHIKTVPSVHSINLITDDSYAMIISEGNNNDIEYGAIYNDRLSISNIRADFEKTWNIASNLDENVILNNVGEAV